MEDLVKSVMGETITPESTDEELSGSEGIKIVTVGAGGRKQHC